MSKRLQPHAWDHESAYYTATHDDLNIEIRLLEPEFVDWYKDLTSNERESWISDMVQYGLEREAGQVYKKHLKKAKADPNIFLNWGHETPQEYAESMREGCFIWERFVHESNYAYLTEEVDKLLTRPWDHNKYVAKIYEDYVNKQIEDTLEMFYITEQEMSRQSVLALRRVQNFIAVRNTFERLQDVKAPSMFVDEQAQMLMAHARDLKRGCTTEELEAINDLYDIYLARQKIAYKINDKALSKKQLKSLRRDGPHKVATNRERSALDRHMPLIKETYDTWTSSVNKKNEIYRNLARTPCSAFSRK